MAADGPGTETAEGTAEAMDGATAAAVVAYLLESCGTPRTGAEPTPRSTLAWDDDRRIGGADLDVATRLVLDAFEFFDSFLDEPPALDRAGHPAQVRHLEATTAWLAARGMRPRAIAEGPDPEAAAMIGIHRALSADAKEAFANEMGVAGARLPNGRRLQRARTALVKAGLAKPDALRMSGFRATPRGRDVRRAQVRWAFLEEDRGEGPGTATAPGAA